MTAAETTPETGSPRRAPRGRDVLVGCAVDDHPRFRAEALRLLRSIQWFGGELAEAKLLVCVVGGVEPGFRAACEALGAEVREVQPFPVPNGSANRLQQLAEAYETGREFLLLLDCDTLVVRDPLPLLRDDVLQAKIAPLPTVTMKALRRAFKHFGVPMPRATYRHALTGEPTIAYCNAGVFGAPRDVLRDLEPAWRRYNIELFERQELIRPCEKHVHQASMAVAMAATGVPFQEVGDELNYQLNMDGLLPADGFLDCEPAILHYHDRIDEDGFLRHCPYPRAQARIDAFNELLRSVTPTARPARARVSPTASAKPAEVAPARIAVLGMHRSGTSALTGLLRAMGAAAGDDEDFPAPDEHNPKGYWEHRAVHALDEQVLAAVGRSWWYPLDVDLGSLPAASREELVSRARAIAGDLDAGGPWVVKDPRLCLVFPLWREALGRPPAVVITHRHPLSVASSLAARDGMPLPVGVALWEVYCREALAATRGLPRMVVGFSQLLADPAGTSRRLADWLAAAAVGDLGSVRALAAEQAQRTVDSGADHWRGLGDDAEGLLAPEQRALLAAFEEGRALDLDPVPPVSSAARAALAVYRQMAVKELSRDYELNMIWQRYARRADELDAEWHRWAKRFHDLETSWHRVARRAHDFETSWHQSARRAHDAETAWHDSARRLHELETSWHQQAQRAHELENSWHRYARIAEERRKLLEQRDEVLAAVFASRSWRLAFGVGKLLRRLIGRRGISVRDRWLALRRSEPLADDT